jgi:hypothetical protein
MISEIEIEVPDNDSDFNAFFAPINDPDAKDPLTWTEIQRSIYVDHWMAAVFEELESLKAKEVYKEVPFLPPGKTVVKCKWVFRIKRNLDGHIARFKARLVAKGYSQVPGEDFDLTFAPVARWDSIRTILSIAAIRDMELRHLDIKTAYLNGHLEEEIYMKMPSIAGNGYWLLKKGLYGLKQAGRAWYIEFSGTMQNIGFARCESDWGVYKRSHGNDLALATTIVDDIALATDTKEESDAITNELRKKYELTDGGDLTLMAACRVTRWRNRRSLMLDQELYTTTLLRDFQMDTANGTLTPFPSKCYLTRDMCPKTEEERTELTKIPYRRLIGKLIYLVVASRPDIAWAVRELSKFVSNYGWDHWKAAKHLLRYLSGTRSRGLIFGNVDNPYPIFRTFTDSDWATGEDRKSISGYIIMIGGGPVAWSSKQQAVIALSSCEAEYLSTSHGARETVWLKSLLDELGFPQTEPPLYCDNTGTIQCAQDPHSHSKMKHIDIRHHFIRDCVNRGLIHVIHIPGIENIADLLTKCLGKIIHRKWLKAIRMDVDRKDVGSWLEEVVDSREGILN